MLNVSSALLNSFERLEVVDIVSCSDGAVVCFLFFVLKNNDMYYTLLNEQVNGGT